MNTQRALVVGGAVVAACVVALLVRGMLGGGTPKVMAALPAPKVATSEILVAANAMQPGTPLTVASVRWQAWPKSDVDDSFITQEQTPNLNDVVQGAVVRAPVVAGEPLTNTKIVHADTAGFMAATLAPGMRAVSISITTESGAGGFILPNDRVDVLATQQINGSQHDFRARTVLSDVRVLAVDQTAKEDKDQKVVLAKTATLELSPGEAMIVAKAQASGALSLSLRPLVEGNARAAADRQSTQADPDVTVIRYGVGHGDQKE
ncbi:MAG TPA: Flp pilus assembly protein CpaB [Rhizomicrobium sp.]|jgi:pilus assembly protein CpaB|nr:Flp pilus assembly protein CpaB [Rhizomicrobium sp.]